MSHTRLAVPLAVAAVLLLAAATGGTTTHHAARGLAFDVATADAGYVELDLTTGQPPTLTLANRFPADVTVTSITVSNATTTIAHRDGLSVPPGESISLHLPGVQCGDAVVVDVTGPQVDLTTSRTLTC